jgi:hypothetical protein
MNRLPLRPDAPSIEFGGRLNYRPAQSKFACGAAMLQFNGEIIAAARSGARVERAPGRTVKAI